MRVLLGGIILATIFEILTCIGRFGFGRQATRDTRWMAPYTGGIRVHHGYPGVILLLIAWGVLGADHPWFEITAILGIGLALSDAVHHWLILWPVTGSPEFDLRYPRARSERDDESD